MKTLPTVQEELSTHLVREVEAAKAYASEQHSSATRRAYRSDFAIFHGWCAARGLASMPAKAATVATVLGSQADSGVKPSTLSRRVAAIRYAHALAGEETPTNAEVVKATMRGIRRSNGAAKDQKSPLTAERLLNVLEQTPDTLRCMARRGRADPDRFRHRLPRPRQPAGRLAVARRLGGQLGVRADGATRAPAAQRWGACLSDQSTGADAAPPGHGDRSPLVPGK